MITDESEQRITLEGQVHARRRRKDELHSSSGQLGATLQDVDHDSFSEVPIMDEEDQVDFYPDTQQGMGEGTEEIEIPSTPIAFHNQTLFCRIFLVSTLYLIAFAAVALIVSGIAIVLAPNGDDDSNNKALSQGNNGIPPPAPANLGAVCTVLNLDLPNGFESCANLCVPAECCWNDYLSAPAASCTETLDHICPDYMPCKVFDQCMKASCCWKTGVEFADSIYVPSAACRSQFNCEFYAVCASLNTAGRQQQQQQQQPTTTVAPQQPTDQIIIPTAPEILSTCKAGSIPNTQKLNQCINACLDGSCCWSSSAISCRDEYPMQCTAYDICTTINENIDTIVGLPITQSPTMAPIAPTEMPVVAPAQQQDDIGDGGDYAMFRTVFEACYNHIDTVLIDGQTLCEKECEKASCCLDEDLDPFSLWDGALCANVDDIQSGGTGGFVQCSNYSPCRKLYPDLVSPAEVACAEGGDTGDCIQVCAKAVCCFTSNATQACSETEQRIVCQDYQSCEVLFENNT